MNFNCIHREKPFVTFSITFYMIWYTLEFNHPLFRRPRDRENGVHFQRFLFVFFSGGRDFLFLSVYLINHRSNY